MAVGIKWVRMRFGFWLWLAVVFAFFGTVAWGLRVFLFAMLGLFFPGCINGLSSLAFWHAS